VLIALTIVADEKLSGVISNNSAITEIFAQSSTIMLHSILMQ